MNGAVTVHRSLSTLVERLQLNDPLTATLIRRTTRAALTLAALVVVSLWLAGLAFGRFIGSPSTRVPQADPLLREVRSSTADVVRFFASSSTEAPGLDLKPQDTYPASIDVHPFVLLGNPFLFPLPPALPAPEPDPHALILQKQIQIPISVKGIVSDARTNVAVLASGETVRTVGPGDAFLDWQVLAVGRDRVLLGMDGMTRTVAWEGSK